MKFVNKFSAIALLLCQASAVAIAQPSISGISGTFTSGSGITVNGSSFGTKATPGPMIFEDFSKGSNGSIIKGKSPTLENLPGTFTWDEFKTASNSPVYTNSLTRKNSTMSSLHTFGGSGYSSSIRAWVTTPNTGDEIYLTFYSYLKKTSSSWSRNYKPWDVFGTNNIFPSIYVGMGNPDTGGGIIRNSAQFAPGNSGPVLWGTTEVPDVEGKWVRHEAYIKQSSPGRADGAFAYWTQFPGSRIVEEGSDYSYQTRADSNVYELFNFGYYYDTDPPGTTANIYLSDIYFDNTQARIEIGDAATWNACTHREVQLPTSWNSSSINFTFRPGSFSANDTVYLYVVDAQGQANSQGYPLNIGGSDSQALAPPMPPTIIE